MTGRVQWPSDLVAISALPDWLPSKVRLYLTHVAGGQSFHEMARRAGCNASTVLRAVRRYEGRRDDPLLDEALSNLALCVTQGQAHEKQAPNTKDDAAMSAQMPAPIRPIDDTTLHIEARRVLRRLAEPGAVLVIAPDLDKAAVMRSVKGGDPVAVTSVERRVAQAFAVKDWIACGKPGRVARYELTAAGLAALRRMMAAEDAAMPGLAEAPSPFASQHRLMEDRSFAEEGGPRRARVNIAESPVSVLGRRKDKAGLPFLKPELVRAAERLREDFEVAHMGPRVAQNWDRFLTPGNRGGFRPDSGLAEGPRAARERVNLALRHLGAELGDVALRVCCHLEGIETMEDRLGLSARSGKELLRVALTYLHRHYLDAYGPSGPLIG